MKIENNWAENVNYNAAGSHSPESADEVAALVRDARKVKALGSRHCFNDIADTDGVHISLARMNRLLAIDAETRTCTIGGGAQYIDFCEELDAAGFALHNLASLANVSVAGACATASHGSGVASPCLAAAVREIELVTANGEIITLNREDADFAGAIVNLGALGIATKLSLRIEDSYQVCQNAFTELPFDALRTNFAALMAAGDSVSLYTDWRDRDIRVVLVKRRVRDAADDLPRDLFGARAATETVGSLGVRDDRRSPHLGEKLPWHVGLPHFRPDHRPAAGNELQSEYYVRPEAAVAAYEALATIREELNAVVVANEIRAVAADEQWLSPFRNRAMIGFHFTWRKFPAAVAALLPKIEAVLAPFDPVPHWGKLFALSPEKVVGHYERHADFAALMKKFDPSGKFRNDFLDRYF